MSLFKKATFFALALIVLVGCKKTKETKKIIGTWDVTEISVSALIFTLPFSDTDTNPSGTITFKSNGIGTQDYTFKLLNDSIHQDENFTWKIKKRGINNG